MSLLDWVHDFEATGYGVTRRDNDLRRHNCAWPGCHDTVWSRFSLERTQRQWWVFCDAHDADRPPLLIVTPQQDP